MKKAILAAVFAALTVEMSLITIAMLGTLLCGITALMAVIFAFLAVSAFGEAIEDTKFGEKLAELFANEEDEQ